jgi:lysophospholipase L1-like esterase
MDRSANGAPHSGARHRGSRVRFTRRGRFVFGGLASLALLLVAFLPGRGAFSSTGTFGLGEDTSSTVRVVAFGDSVPAGYACDCQAFPPMYADLIHRTSGRRTVWTNYAVSGLVADGVLAQLQQPAVADSVRRAGVVLVMVGANDFVAPFQQLGNNPKPTTQFAATGANLKSTMVSVIGRVRQLAGPKVRVVVLGYWNVLEDGKAAAHDYTSVQRTATLAATKVANNALWAAAAAGGATYVPTVQLFRGSGDNRDPSALLAADGDHPNVAGHRAIAQALAAAVPIEPSAG